MQQENEAQQAALYGPAARYSEHRKGETITFRSTDTQGRELTGEILFVRAPGTAIQGGRCHPTLYMVFVPGESFPRVVYPVDVIQAQE